MQLAVATSRRALGTVYFTNLLSALCSLSRNRESLSLFENFENFSGTQFLRIVFLFFSLLFFFVFFFFVFYGGFFEKVNSNRSNVEMEGEGSMVRENR